MGLRTLSPLEARVLGVLIEKAHTVPDTKIGLTRI